MPSHRPDTQYKSGEWLYYQGREMPNSKLYMSTICRPHPRNWWRFVV